MSEENEREHLQGMLIHWLYTFCLHNEISMNLFQKGKEDLKERLNNFYENIKRFNENE